MMADDRNKLIDARPPIFSAEEWDHLTLFLELSPRQAEVAGLVMQSKKDKEIAKALSIAKRTVREHISDLFVRLDASDRIGIAYRIFEAFRKLT